MHVLINIDVPDIESGLRFYTAAFGLTVGRRFDTDFAELLGGPVKFYLLAKPAGSITAGQDRRRYERHWTPIHPDIVVDDVDAAVARAIAAGATLEVPAKDAAYGRIAMLGDPFGHGFCLIEFNAEGYDALLPRPQLSALFTGAHRALELRLISLTNFPDAAWHRNCSDSELLPSGESYELGNLWTDTPFRFGFRCRHRLAPPAVVCKRRHHLLKSRCR